MSTSEANKGRLQRYRAERNRLKAENEKLAARVKELEALPDATELAEQVEALYGQVRDGAHREAWEQAAAELNVDPKHLDDLWKIDPPDTSADEPDPKAIRKHLKATIADRPHVLKTEDDEQEGEGDDDGQEGEGDDEFDGRDGQGQGDGTGGAGTAAGTGAGRKSPSVLDLARSLKKKDDARAEGKSRDKGNGDANPKSATNTKTKLTRGEGASRGGRDDHKTPTIADVVDADFAKTGRTDPYRL